MISNLEHQKAELMDELAKTILDLEECKTHEDFTWYNGFKQWQEHQINRIEMKITYHKSKFIYKEDFSDD